MVCPSTARQAIAGRFFVALVSCLLAAASAGQSTPALSDLAQAPTWLRLLKADKSATHASAIHSPEFFAAPADDWSPHTELATLVQLLQAPDTVDDAHVRCRFPARALWLSEQLREPAWRDFGNCRRLNAWANLEALDSISLIMISGYFGNPASTFGHSLLRLNNGDADSDSTLLDLGINFGAQVPPGDGTLAYIIRGLFGGYTAGFSDRTFFEHDQTYSRIEFRDRWEYELNLDAEQRQLLAYHLWELAGRKFTYYFLHQNCSYRLAELLELVFAQPLLDDVDVWYAPVSLFHDLRALRVADGAPAFRSIDYVPSVEQVLRYSLADLDDAEREAVLALVDPGRPVPQAAALAAASLDATRVFAAALDYFTYRLANADDASAASLRARKNTVLVARLALPAAPRRLARPPARTPPSARAAPSAIEIGPAYNRFTGDHIGVGIAAFRYANDGNNALQGSSLVVADLALGIDTTDGVFLERLDVVRASKLNAPRWRLPDESAVAWGIGAGLERARENCLSCIEAFGEGWLGRSWRLGNNLTATAALAGRLSSKDDAVEGGPRVSLLHRPGQRFAAELVSTYELALTRGGQQWQHELQARWSWSSRFETTLSVRRRDATEGRLLLAYRY